MAQELIVCKVSLALLRTLCACTYSPCLQRLLSLRVFQDENVIRAVLGQALMLAFPGRAPLRGFVVRLRSFRAAAVLRARQLSSFALRCRG